MLIDTHVHLNDNRLLTNIDYYINRAKTEGVDKMIVIGYDYISSKEAVRIANSYDNIYASIGLHPSELKDIEDDLEWLKDLAKNSKVIAIGEIGLDYYWDKTYNEKQKRYFIKQIEIANELNKPIIIHSRDAIQETFAIVKEYSKVKGVLHCYSGSIEMAKEYVKLGFYFGIGGVITFKNSKLPETINKIGLDYIISETDAPYMAPVPYRGTTNEPAYVIEVVKAIAKAFSLSEKEVEVQIEKNVYNLFGI